MEKANQRIGQHTKQFLNSTGWEEYRINNPDDHIATSRSRLGDIANVLSNKMQNDSPPEQCQNSTRLGSPEYL